MAPADPTMTARHSSLRMIALVVLSAGMLTTCYFVARGLTDEPSSLPPLSLGSAEGKGQVDTVTKGVVLDWSHDSDLGSELAGWPTRLGPRQNGIAPGIPLRTDLDQQLPRENWSREIGRGYSTVVVDELGRYVLHHRVEDRETIECGNIDDGSVNWTVDYPTTFVQPNTKYTDGPVATPVIHNGHVFSLGVQGKMHCIDLDDGEIKWQRDLEADYQPPVLAFGVGASPLIYEDSIIVALGAVDANAGIVALDLATGETRWQSTRHTASYSTPCIAHVGQHTHLICLTNEGLISLNPANGKMRWEIPFRGRIPDSENACTPVVMDNLVLASAYGKGCIGLELQEDGSYLELWRDVKRPVLDVHYNNMLGLNGYVYGFSATDRTFRCVDARTGELVSKWRSPMRRGYSIKVGDYFLLVGEHGYLAMLTLEQGELTPVAITQTPLIDYPLYGMPSFWKGHILLKNESKLASIDLSVSE